LRELLAAQPGHAPALRLLGAAFERALQAEPADAGLKACLPRTSNAP
jgi:hypothetical protein